MRPLSMIPGVINSGYEDTTDREPKQSMDCSVSGVSYAIVCDECTSTFKK